jgi:hypothetical protein
MERTLQRSLKFKSFKEQADLIGRLNPPRVYTAAVANCKTKNENGHLRMAVFISALVENDTQMTTRYMRE